MSRDRRLEVVRHISEEELDRLLNQTDDEKVSKRLTFIKRLYKGATPIEAANDIGKSESTGNRWLHRWNKGSLSQLTPNFGGGRPQNSTKTNSKSFLNSCARADPGNHERFNSYSSTNSMLSSIRIVSGSSFVISVSPTRNHDQSD